MPIESPPSIVHPYEPVPNPNQGRTAFNTNMQATFNAWPQTSASQEAMGLWMESTANQTEQWAIDAAQAVTDATTAGNEQVQLAAQQVTAAQDAAGGAEGFASDAQNFANIAAAAANFLGTWTSLGTSAVTAFSGMAFHDGSFYVPLVNLANASSVEPGTDPATWLDYIELVSGGLTKVSSNTDTTTGNVVDVGWLVSRGIGGSHDASGRTFTNPNNLAGLGLISGRCDGETIGISGLTDTDIGVLTIEAQATDTSVAGTVALTFKRGSQVWIRSNTNATNWAAWSRLRGVSEVVGEAQGGTGETTFAASLAALGGAAAGSIATSGLTMTSDRIVGRLAAGTGAPQLLTENDLKTGFDLASSGRVADTGITSATARLMGRVAAGTGAVAELPASDVLTFLGIASSSLVPSGAGWVAAGGNVRFIKIGSLVIVSANFTSTGTGVGVVTLVTIPAGFVPAANAEFRAASNGEFGASATFTSGSSTLSVGRGTFGAESGYNYSFCGIYAV